MDGQLNLSADGYIPSALIDAMVEEIDQPRGGIRVKAQIQGPMKSPAVSGNISLESVGLMLTETMQKFHEINGQISYTNQAVTISGLRGRLDTGKFSLEGKIDIENFAPKQANLNLIAQALPYEIDGMLEMQINSDLRISGTPDKSSLSGSIELLDGHYYKDVNLSLIDTVGEISKRKRQTAPRTETAGIDLPFLRNLSLDVSLSSRNPFAVDNNIALLSIIPALRIRGDANNPMISGRAKVTEGTITYRDTEFEIKKGWLILSIPIELIRRWTSRLNPGSGSGQLQMAVSGTSENLDFKFSSNPPEEDADILSLLLVGKTTREMAAGSGGDAQSPEEMLANLVAGKLAGQVKEATGLDIVELEYKAVPRLSPLVRSR
ncbi:MAG: translocation/assembly module TamB domain-containing protein [Desulfobacterales bacterium]